MIVGVGLVLLGLTLYMSTLAYTLRDYSRAQLSLRLAEHVRQRRLEWLDRHESELQALTGLVRLLANVALLVTILWWSLRSHDGPLELVALIWPAVVALVLLLVFAIALPHWLAYHAGEVLLASGFPLLKLLRLLLRPVAWLLSASDFVVRRLLGVADWTAAEENERVEQEILDAVSEGEAAGAVHEDQKEIIESVFEFDDTDVSAVMTPRTDIHAVQADATYEDVRQKILDSGHSRIPVFENSVDHIVGVLYAKDLLRLNGDGKFNIRALMRVVPYVPESKSIHDLLEEFRQSKVQIAIVLDEYGGTAGLVTIEDILEELVGEIDDEYDVEAPPDIQRIDADTLEVDARVHVDEINEELNIELPEEDDYETIGGFVFSKLGKIPVEGEEFQHDNVRFQVIAAEPRRIGRLRIRVGRQAKAG